MSGTIAAAVTDALPAAADAGQDGDEALGIDLGALQDQLAAVAHEAVAAKNAGVALADAVYDPDYPALAAFHRDLRDSLLVELPKEVRAWVQDPRGAPGADLADVLMGHARTPTADDADTADRQRALAELLVFEAVRLRLLVTVWSNEDYERLGGDERDIDAIAWEEVCAMLHDPALDRPGVRPLRVMYAAATVALAKDAADRAGELRRCGPDIREELTMRARLRAALRELRLTESVLLENALSTLLGGERRELPRLQAERPVALEGLSRQAMDQRVSRGRRALTRPPASWPRRRHPALFDLLRG